LKKYIIIVAGGRGTRMNSEIPKQFMMLNGKPILLHSLELFYGIFPEAGISVVLPEEETPRWRTLLMEFKCDISHEIVPGGETRFHSVKNALDRLSGEGIVAIHDGARPLVTEALVLQAFHEAERSGAAVPAILVHESVRMVEKGSGRPVDRSTLRIIQTPQVFKLPAIKKAYEQPYREAFTDDATVLEASGETVCLIDGDPVNIKITNPGDLLIAQALTSRPFQR
jgi:2-C-methyl-D-erythritol 4-phosphate cytidylyltransferase